MLDGDGRRLVGDCEAVRTVGSTASWGAVDEPEATLERWPTLEEARYAGIVK
jgi:hypothetical protein